MNEQTFRKLEFHKVKEQVATMTVSPAGLKLAEAMAPSQEYARVAAWLQETEEASELLAAGASIPLSAMEGIDVFLSLLGKGRIYMEQELEQLGVWLTSVAQMKKYMNAKRQHAPTIAGYADSMYDCPELREELHRSIRYGSLTDEASPDLAYIRRQTYAVEDNIQKRMAGAMGKYKSSLQESVISRRSGRFVLSVKRELRKNVPGTVLDESASGQTLFIEPLEVAELQLELHQWKAAEERERTVVLSRLSDQAEAYSSELKTNVQAMAIFDFIVARAKYARSCGGRRIGLSDKPIVSLRGARHPLLGRECVPLVVELGIAWNQLMITGPNTGGKTVTLKTIGLLTIMNQCGLLVPAEPDSELGLFAHIEADVGDGQSLEQSLSTFSSHISVLKDMLKYASGKSLLLLDELAAGTDPSEGIALSIAVLEQLKRQGAKVAGTTHFNEIKTFASRTEGCQNGRMAFDPETLRPLYRLEIGEAGDSHAFAIARRFGLPEGVMMRAEELLQRKGERNAAYVEVPDPSEARTDLEVLRGEINNKKTEANRENKHGGAVLPASDHGGELAGPVSPAKKRGYVKGDAVWIYPLKRAGVVFREADERGNLIVQVKGEKLVFNHKRLKPYIAKEKLYPGETYDLDIVFESKENRKARHLMNRKHAEGVEIVIKPEDQF
ncbi:DNA mismatch repair protein MutS [Paenibacillus sp. LHD-117]|uniref:endonuclease MutS2 n=1 Tax=Paenibacillus sp. LHD-117 TaxID=3071412 RepID=UPI0027DEB4BB|nr:DNA mismatch repair protein MutS [Paenibacillus sp. LHD-117]MDQ6418077.1 DNA mismatch repair protein MutS [Paenibacillus sp. LHD-117]